MIGLLANWRLMALGLGLATIAGLGWYAVDQHDKRVLWQREAQEAALKIDGWRVALEGERARAELAEMVLAEREEAHNEIVAQNAKLSQEIERLKHDKPEVADFLSRPIPPDLLERLRDHASGSAAP